MPHPPWFELVWPSTCAACGSRGGGLLCDDCLPPNLHRASVPVLGLSGAWVLCGYDAPLGGAVAGAKSRGDRPLMACVADELGVRAARMIPRGAFEAIVPAPSAWRSLLRRGWSGASVLGAAVSRETGVPLRHLARRLGGPAQAGLDRQARRRNLRGRIRVDVPISGRVLVVDDVVTTGATLQQCVQELLGAGAREVWALAACAAR